MQSLLGKCKFNIKIDLKQIMRKGSKQVHTVKHCMTITDNVKSKNTILT